MKNEAPLFWAAQETAKPITVESFVENITPQEAIDFSEGLRQIYQATAAVNPDVVFLPERGAAPFGWALEFFGQKEGRSFLQVPMIIGTGTDVLSGQIGGQRKPEKMKNVQRAVEIATDITSGIRNPLLIDEVQFGGTISHASHYLHVLLEGVGVHAPLNLIAVEDSRMGGWQNKKAKGYSRLVSNTRPHLKSTVVRMPLFTIDRDETLNRLLVEPHVSHSEPLPMIMHNKLQVDLSSENSLPMPMVMHNIPAKSAVESLLRIYSNPGAESADDSSWINEYKRLCREIKAA